MKRLREKVDRQNISLYVSVILSVIIFALTWIFGIGKTVVYSLTLFGICAIPLFWLIPKSSKGVITYAYTLYLGMALISLSKFKTDIANWDVDINMIGVGLALVALAIVLNTQRKEQKAGDESATENSTPEASDEAIETMTKQELPSIDIVLDEVRRKLDFQFEQLDGIRMKSGIVLGVAGVIFTLLVTNLLGQPSTITNLFLAKIALIPIFLLWFYPLFQYTLSNGLDHRVHTGCGIIISLRIRNILNSM